MIQELDDEQENLEQQEIKKVEQDYYHHEDANDISSIFKKRKSFQKFLDDSKFHESKAQKNLQWGVMIFICVLILLCILDYVIIQIQLSHSKNFYDLVVKSNLRIADAQSL